MPSSRMGFRHYITKTFEHETPTSLLYSVCLKDGDAPIGDVGLHDIDWVNRTAETSAWIGDPAYRDSGYGTEAKFLLLEIAFDLLQLHVLVSWIWEPNKRSAAAVTGQGYQPAGRLAYDDVRGGAMHDGVVFDVLRDEYLAARAVWEQRVAARMAEAAAQRVASEE
jgi:RimJ/RimL family protein N-acetyltransferase